MKKIVYGLYYPSDYIMEVNFELERIVEEATAYTRGTFLHEYTHFIQEFSYYGIWRFNIMHQIFREIYVKYQQKLAMEIPMPFCDYTNESKINYCLYKIFSGSDELLISKNDINNLSIELINNEDYTEFVVDGFDLGKIKHVLITNTRNGNKYSFGSTAICESMASLIERYVYMSEDDSNVYDLPYDACQLVVDLLHSRFGNVKSNIVALCEIALSVQNPGELFYKSLIQMKKDRFLPQNPDEIWAYHNNNFSFINISDEEVKKNQENLFFSNLNDFYGLFYSKTLKNSYMTIRKFENDDRLFWIKGLKQPPIEADQYYNNLMQKIKYPLMIDNDTGKLYINGTSPENDNLLYIYPMHIINKLLLDGKFDKCSLLPICKCRNCTLATPWLNNPNLCMISNSWKLRLLPTDVKYK